MKILPISTFNSHNKINNLKKSSLNINNEKEEKGSENNKNLYYYSNHINQISFRSTDPNRLVADMEFENYRFATAHTRQKYRKLYLNFTKLSYIDKSLLFDPQEPTLPLMSEKTMDNFIEISKKYLKYKEQPIICLGRSPKWFLNTALWMKDGIKNYDFIAFSKYWYRPDSREGAVRINKAAPTEKEVVAYRKYLSRKKVDPKTIVENYNKTGQKTVITDYIHSGKGACSFLEIMGEYAKDLGVLEEFSKSIQIVGIGSMDYLEDMNPLADTLSIPKVPMPEVLRPYYQNIKQEFYNMDYTVFREMLLNQNTNECRSTYYPHDAWTVYKPDQFKTGQVKDMKKIQNLLKTLKGEKKYITSFSAIMQDFRNLLNFRILSALDARKLLKESHITKI